ncbi:MAG: hypothetical protein N3A67_08260 [Ignavibacteria bacterium]|nr:hypothetical protein [Ignavibacteria bacterium]
MYILNNSYCHFSTKERRRISRPPFSLPASRAGKILQFRHYQTDAPV